MHEKVRIADLIDITKLNWRGLGTYALQAHFDFVLIDEPAGQPALNCVYGFEQVREINAITFVKYLVELIFHARIFLQMKNDGMIAPDEAFALSGFLKPQAKHILEASLTLSEMGMAN